MITNPTELRYFDTKRLHEERATIYGYFEDAIRTYGKDVKYYKMSTDITSPGKESSEMGYGFDPHRKVVAIADLRAYINFSTFNFQFNQFGFEPKAELVFYFSLNDFAVNFIDELGKFRKFDIERKCGNLKYNGEDRIQLPFTSEITSGIVEFEIPKGYDGRFLDGEIVAMYEPIYRIVQNPYIHKSFTSDFHGRYFVPSIRAKFEYGKISGANYILEGSLLYSGYEEARIMSDIIRPGIGDIIEVPYDTEDNHVEQYEISQVLDRLPTTGNTISPLLGRYVWQCHAVRRVASEGDEVGLTKEAEDKQDRISTYIESRERANRRDNYDWNKVADDDHVYGSYDTDEKNMMNQDRKAVQKADPEKENRITSKEITAKEDDKVGWQVIVKFKDGNMITTDGNLLFYENGKLRRELVKGFDCDWDVEFRHTHFRRAHLFNMNGNLCFMGMDKKLKRITSFDEDVASVGITPNGAFYADDIAMMSDDWYIFNESKMAIYSKNDELICVSKKGEEEVVASI